MNVTAPNQDATRVMRRRGALILPLFALVWAAAGVSGIADARLALTAGLVVVAFAAMAIVLALRGGRTSEMARPLDMPEDWNRQLTRVNVFQAVGIGLSIVVLVVVGRPEVIPAVVCLIVGMHFLPLARIFGQEQYTWTGTALFAVSTAGFAALSFADGPTSRAVVGLGAAASLLVTALQLAARE